MGSLEKLPTNLKIAVIQYCKWLMKHKLDTPMETPAMIGKIFYEKNWSDKYIPVVEYIFKFLVLFEILEESGDMFSLRVQNLNLLIDRLYTSISIKIVVDQQPVYVFIELLLNSLDVELDWDQSIVDIEQHSLLWESVIDPYADSIALVAHEKLINKNSITDDISVCIIGENLYKIIEAIASTTMYPENVDIVVPNKLRKDQLISQIELNSELSDYLPRIKLYEDDSSKSYEVIVAFCYFGLYLEESNAFNLIRARSHPGTEVLFQICSTDQPTFGFEPLLKLIKQWRFALSTSNFKTKFSNLGYSKIETADDDKKIFTMEFSP